MFTDNRHLVRYEERWRSSDDGICTAYVTYGLHQGQLFRLRKNMLWYAYPQYFVALQLCGSKLFLLAADGNLWEMHRRKLYPCSNTLPRAIGLVDHDGDLCLVDEQGVYYTLPFSEPQDYDPYSADDLIITEGKLRRYLKGGSGLWVSISLPFEPLEISKTEYGNYLLYGKDRRVYHFNGLESRPLKN